MKARQIVITRPAIQAEKFAQRLSESGFEPLHLPLIKTIPISPNPAFEAVLSGINEFKWIVLTSVNAVDFWFKMTSTSVDGSYAEENSGFPTKPEFPPDLSIAAVGPVTARRLADYGLKKVWLPSKYTGECLAEELPFAKGDKILLPRARKAMKSLPRILAERGAKVTDLPIYDTVENNHSEQDFIQIIDRKPEVVTFTSPSAVISFKKHLEKFGLIKPKTYYAAIGPTTGKVLQENDFSLDILPEVYTLDGLIEAIKDFLPNE